MVVKLDTYTYTLLNVTEKVNSKKKVIPTINKTAPRRAGAASSSSSEEGLEYLEYVLTSGKKREADRMKTTTWLHTEEQPSQFRE